MIDIDHVDQLTIFKNAPELVKLYTEHFNTRTARLQPFNLVESLKNKTIKRAPLR